jgi:hypothetical protein
MYNSSFIISTIINRVKKPRIKFLRNVIKELPFNSKYALLTLIDKILLHEISKNLPQNGIVAEIGTFLGGSASIIANASPTSEIHTYDLFNNYENPITDVIGYTKSHTIENVSELVAMYPNISLHKVEYLIEPDLDKMVNLLVEDASHRNPQFSSSLDVWLPRVKVNGIVLIHDYRPWLQEHNPKYILDKSEYYKQYFPDVIRYVDQLALHDDWRFHGAVGSYAVFERIS